MKIKTKRALIAYIGGMFFMIAFTTAFKAYERNLIAMITSPVSLILAVVCFIYAIRR